MIKKRTRQGFGVRNGVRERLKPLSRSYIAKRRRMRLSLKTSPSKSNLTLTGSLINNLYATNEDKNTSIVVAPKDADKARWVSGDRPFLDLTDQEVKQIKQHLLTEMKR